MTPAEIFDGLDDGLTLTELIAKRLPGDAADIFERVIDALADALPHVQRLVTTDGWDAGDVKAVREILIVALSEAPDLPDAEATSYADAFARLISRAVSAGLKQEAPTVRGHGRRRRRVLADVGDHVESSPHADPRGIVTTLVDVGALDPDRKPVLRRVDR